LGRKKRETATAATRRAIRDIPILGITPPLLARGYGGLGSRPSLKGRTCPIGVLPCNDETIARFNRAGLVYARKTTETAASACVVRTGGGASRNTRDEQIKSAPDLSESGWTGRATAQAIAVVRPVAVRPRPAPKLADWCGIRA